MQPLLIPCPQCGRELRLRDSALLGRRGKCPKCRHRFVLEHPDEAQRERLDSTPAPAAQAAVETSARWVLDDLSAGGDSSASPPPAPVMTELVQPSVASASEPQSEWIDIQTACDGSVARLQRVRRKSAQRKKITLAVGTITAVTVVLLVFLTQGSRRDSIHERPRVDKQSQAEKNSLEEDQALAKSASPTRGGPIKLLYVPSGARMVVNVHPEELWQAGSMGEEFRDCLGAGINSWIEKMLKEICLFEPVEIEEALICLLLGERGTPPEVAAVVRLVEEHQPADLILKFQAERDESFGHRALYLNDEHVFIILDQKTFVVAPRNSASQMVDALTTPQATDTDIEEIINQTDRDRHLTVIFEPLDLQNFQDVLVPPKARSLLNMFVDWFGEDVSTVVWSLHLGNETFHSEMLLRTQNVSRPRTVRQEFRNKLDALPHDVLAAVEKMNPAKLGPRQIIGRFPAMVYGYSESTLEEIGRRYVRLITVLPERAAPNLAAGLVLTWIESLRTDFSKSTPTGPTGTQLPDRIADRLKRKIEIDFRNTPLYAAFDYIGTETRVQFKVNGDALKVAGMTQNMTQNQKLGVVPALKAIQAIISQYKMEGMCIVVDEQAKLVTVTTVSACVEQGLKPFSVVPQPGGAGIKQ